MIPLADKPTTSGYAYRCLRRYETPWIMREPQLPQLSHQEMRALLLPGVAMGNSKQHTSPFLHCTTDVLKARAIRMERAHLYSNWLVRWPKNCARHIDLSDKQSQRAYLEEDTNDSAFLDQCLREVRSYSLKDKELVYLERPQEADVEWWNESTKSWRPVEEGRQWQAARLGFRAAATSQAPNEPPPPTYTGAADPGPHA